MVEKVEKPYRSSKIILLNLNIMCHTVLSIKQYN